MGLVVRRKIERYYNMQKIRYYTCRTGMSSERKYKTVYVDGNPYVMDVRSGEILRLQNSLNIKKSVDDSVARSKRVVREILAANTWDYFITLTFNGDKVDRFNDDEVVRLYSKFRRNMRRNFPEMRSLVIPERHKSGALHFHMVVGKISAADLCLVDSGKMTDGKEPKPIFNVTKWTVGFSTATEVGDQKRVCSYMLKYIGKDFGVSEPFKRRYWASKNCARPEKIVQDVEVSFADFNRVNMLETAFHDLKMDVFQVLDCYVPESKYVTIIDYDVARLYRRMNTVYCDYPFFVPRAKNNPPKKCHTYLKKRKDRLII